MEALDKNRIGIRLGIPEATEELWVITRDLCFWQRRSL